MGINGVYKGKKIQILYFFALVLYCLNFRGEGIFIPFLLLPFLLIHLIFYRFNIRYFSILGIIIAFSTIFTLTMNSYGYISSSFNFYSYLLYPVCLFMLGELVARKDGADHEMVYNIIFGIIFSFVLFSFLSLMKTMNSYGDMDVATKALNGRYVLNIWNDGLISATGFNTYLSFGLIMLPICFMSFKELRYGKIMKFFCVLSFMISLYGIITLANRTGFVLILVSIIAVSLLVGKVTYLKIIKWFFGVLFVSLINFLYENNMSIKYFLLQYPLFSRFNEMNMGNDPRFETWKEALQGLFINPTGGRKTSLSLNYAHNMWLDVGYDVGMLSFFLLGLITFLALLALRNFVKSNQPILLKALIVGLYTAMFLTFMVEPIFQGWFTYFTIFCFVFGLTHGLNFNYRVSRENNIYINSNSNYKITSS
ncbi:hypothetical protein COL48_00530 [Bacillus toyonensis]|uniref:hypothetical protein n=1 Tax=Bacillus toyonensis TaxID=155322 RepID=UPI000BF5AF6D|nr:hypothetical protein [Bacillus toyonensis]PFY35240.1 hypothetical protein COL48_00530 [Bacillus toyonensis]